MTNLHIGLAVSPAETFMGDLSMLPDLEYSIFLATSLGTSYLGVGLGTGL